MSFVSTTNATTTTGIFVGNQVSFSDTMLNLVKAELPFVGFRRTASTADIMFAKDELANSVQIIIIDETMWGDLAAIVPQLRDKFKNANIALAYRRVDHARQFMAANHGKCGLGDVGYLPMNVQLDCWLSALRLLVCGERFVPNELLAMVPLEETVAAPTVPEDVPQKDVSQEEAPAEVTPDAEPCGEAGLTAREFQVLKAVAEGKQNKIIAEELQLSQHTVKLHIHHMMSKLGIHNRTEAAIWYLGKHGQPDGANA